jgi:hypothetical protein
MVLTTMDNAQENSTTRIKGWKLPLFLGGYTVTKRMASLMAAGYVTKTAVFAYVWKTYPVVKVLAMKAIKVTFLTFVGAVETVAETFVKSQH